MTRNALDLVVESANLLLLLDFALSPRAQTQHRRQQPQPQRHRHQQQQQQQRRQQRRRREGEVLTVQAGFSAPYFEKLL
ncbi:hypothetical protein KIN20_004599 [Parelaphostrongylus tenuis]|uniref:Uncharacterized protein n=1 Tax=Parelaphostrongylus tenuis TaxID=148309 RepID=A0AAD5LYQ8_PARTN|nr:hypothetical protein KIN20_004599 [Parelaphostrongylus tenuis]